MKKYQNTLFKSFATLTIATPIVAVMACGSSTSTSIKIEEKGAIPAVASGYVAGELANKKIAAVFPDPENARFQRAKTTSDTNATNLGFGTKVSMITKNNQEQVSWLGTNASDADVVVVSNNEHTVGTAWSTWPATRPVISYDRLTKTEQRTAYNWYVTYDNTKIGFIQGLSIINGLYKTTFTETSTQAEILAAIPSKKLSAKKLVVALAGDPGDNNAGLFYNGGMDLLKEVAKIDSNFVIPSAFDSFNKVSTDGWNAAKGQENFDGKLQALGAEKSNIGAVFVSNDDLSAAARNALKQHGIDPTKVYMTGQDSNNAAIQSIYLETGQDMTIYKPDTTGTAVTLALARLLALNATKYNVADASEHYDEITTEIKKIYANIDFSISKDLYSTNDAGTAKINTIQLVPKMITKSNVESFFTITK